MLSTATIFEGDSLVPIEQDQWPLNAMPLPWPPALQAFENPKLHQPNLLFEVNPWPSAESLALQAFDAHSRQLSRAPREPELIPLRLMRQLCCAQRKQVLMSSKQLCPAHATRAEFDVLETVVSRPGRAGVEDAADLRAAGPDGTGTLDSVVLTPDASRLARGDLSRPEREPECPAV